MKFEYETEGFSPSNFKTLTSWLNERGADGWELVHMDVQFALPGPNSYKVVWMRPSEGSRHE